MSGYRGHIVGGLVTYGIVLCIVRQWLHPTNMTEVEWLLFTVAGSLFPDIDIKSKGHNWAYSFLFILFCALLSRGHYEVVAVASVLSLLPMIVRHRGLFHRLWFIISFAVIGIVVGARATSLPYIVFIWDALFFVLGALSHLILDLGVKRAFRIR